MSRIYMHKHVVKINIPAYDALMNGVIVEFKLSLYPQSKFSIEARGNIAVALKNNFMRVIEIMSSLKVAWNCLENVSYVLESHHDQFIVKDAKSSSMAFSIALLNSVRILQGLVPIDEITGTGILRIDGSFENSHLQDKKYLAAKKEVKTLNQFITPSECKHLSDLERLIYEYH